MLLMIAYWFAHMDWPFIENTNNLIVDYHLVYAGVLVYLIVKRAGHVFGLDAMGGKARLSSSSIPRSSRWLPETTYRLRKGCRNQAAAIPGGRISIAEMNEPDGRG